MKRNMRCVACGRQRKQGHEKRCGTPKSYAKECKRYEDFDYKAWTIAFEAEKKAKEDAIKAEQKAKEDAIKAEEEAKKQAEPVQTAVAEVAEVAAEEVKAQ